MMLLVVNQFTVVTLSNYSYGRSNLTKVKGIQGLCALAIVNLSNQATVVCSYVESLSLAYL